MYAFRADLMKIRLQVLTSKVAFPLDQQDLPLWFCLLYGYPFATPLGLVIVLLVITNVTGISSRLTNARVSSVRSERDRPLVWELERFVCFIKQSDYNEGRRTR